jgi:hypothetical protein
MCKGEEKKSIRFYQTTRCQIPEERNADPREGAVSCTAVRVVTARSSVEANTCLLSSVMVFRSS